jgi:hypothetical protein
MNYYKLTDKNMQTYNGFQWKLKKWFKTSGNGGLCGDGWLHLYHDPLLAQLLNPIHAGFNSSSMRLFKAECMGKAKDTDGLKIGFTEVRLIEELPLRKLTTKQRVFFGLLCAKEVYKEKKWNIWADNWLSGKDREFGSAGAAARAAWAAAQAAEAGAWTAEEAGARAAAQAAEAGARASAEAGARAAAWTAAWGRIKGEELHLIKLAEKACLIGGVMNRMDESKISETKITISVGYLQELQDRAKELAELKGKLRNKEEILHIRCTDLVKVSGELAELEEEYDLVKEELGELKELCTDSADTLDRVAVRLAQKGD